MVTGGVLVLGGLGWGAVSVARHVTYGTVMTEDRLAVSVEVGEWLSLAVPDKGPSVGDIWSAEAVPAEHFEDAAEHTIKGDVTERFFGSPPGGGSGTIYFSYTAKRAGTATVVVTHCFRGCGDARTRSMSRTVTWTITVE